MEKLAKDFNRAKDRDAQALHGLELEPIPLIGTGLSASVAKKRHHEPMLSGYLTLPPLDPAIDFNPQKCNITLDTLAYN